MKIWSKLLQPSDFCCAGF